jgi:hypothetical protein
LQELAWTRRALDFKPFPHVRALRSGRHARAWSEIEAECFTVIGSAATFEWQQLEDELPVRFAFSDAPSGWRGRSLTHERIEAPDRADLLPEC